ncbi:unnamed protein product [Dicrocoelium dendriticum]|nr:unnamed protein product [Dicrocoelium dendriticum]
MGVRGLHSYIAQNPGNFTSTRLHNTYLVIDAENLVNTRYRESGLASYYGGELIEFQVSILKFVRLLQRCCIKPIFVFDGCHEQNVSLYDQVYKCVFYYSMQTLSGVRSFTCDCQVPPCRSTSGSVDPLNV